jgi:hypothetical protein
MFDDGGGGGGLGGAMVVLVDGNTRKDNKTQRFGVLRKRAESHQNQVTLLARDVATPF